MLPGFLCFIQLIKPKKGDACVDMICVGFVFAILSGHTLDMALTTIQHFVVSSLARKCVNGFRVMWTIYGHYQLS